MFPDRTLTASEVQALLKSESLTERCWIISQLIRYAAWEEVWELVTREEVQKLWPHLDLPATLREKLARALKLHPETKDKGSVPQG